MTQEARLRRGLPTGRFFSRSLVFDVETQTLVLCAQVHETGAVATVYIRSINEEQYASVSALCEPLIQRGTESEVIVTSWVVSSGILFCVVATTGKSGLALESQVPVRAVDFQGLARIDLRTRDVTMWQGLDERTTIAELLAAAKDRIYATIATRNVDGQGPLEYALAEVQWGTNSISLLSSMPDRFF